jgi:hypothetical protein
VPCRCFDIKMVAWYTMQNRGKRKSKKDGPDEKEWLQFAVPMDVAIEAIDVIERKGVSMETLINLGAAELFSSNRIPVPQDVADEIRDHLKAHGFAVPPLVIASPK